MPFYLIFGILFLILVLTTLSVSCRRPFLYRLNYLDLLLTMSSAGIPFGIWLAFKRDMGLHGLWIGLTLSLIYAATIGVWICLTADWDREVKKVRDRIAADKQAAAGLSDDAEVANGH